MLGKIINKNKITLLFITLILSLTSLKIFPIYSEENKELLLNESISAIEENEINESPYIIGPSDVIDIVFIDEPDLNETNVVLNDGTLSIPVIGNLKVSGLSILQAQFIINQKLSSELIKPNARLIVRKPRPMRIAVLGEVQNPGIYTISASDTSNVVGKSTSIQTAPTIIEAIQKSGGITKLSNLTEIEITRKIPGYNGGFKKAKVNLLEAILEGEHEQNPLIFDQDKIYIPKATNIGSSEKSNLASTNLSPLKIEVYFIGEFNKPGVRAVSSTTPLIQGILQAGGPKYWRGNAGNVELVRLNRNGTVNKRRFRLNLNKDASSKYNPLLKNGDIVIIKRTKIAAGTDALVEVTKPFTAVLNAISLYRLLD